MTSFGLEVLGDQIFVFLVQLILSWCIISKRYIDTYHILNFTIAVQRNFLVFERALFRQTYILTPYWRLTSLIILFTFQSINYFILTVIQESILTSFIKSTTWHLSHCLCHHATFISSNLFTILTFHFNFGCIQWCQVHVYLILVSCLLGFHFVVRIVFSQIIQVLQTNSFQLWSIHRATWWMLGQINIRISSSVLLSGLHIFLKARFHILWGNVRLEARASLLILHIL